MNKSESQPHPWQATLRESLPQVAVAGASGFVGSRLREHMGEHFNWIALTRSQAVSSGSNKVSHTHWRHCDVFSLPQVKAAIEGAHTGIYLVHSMLPSSRLVQASFADMDALLADNFARAAKAAGLKHIIFLGGLIPQDRSQLSPHLRSRLEVEKILRQSGLPVTVLRAGLIVGPGGSSTGMLIRLVHRLPVMLLPKWTTTLTQSIDVRDVLRAFSMVLTDSKWWGGTYDLGGHPVMSYGKMIRRTADVMERHTRFIHWPFYSIRPSRLWVRCLSGVSSDLVNPLLESLTHNLQAAPNPLMEKLSPDCIAFDESIRSALDDQGNPIANPRSLIFPIDRKTIRAEKRVRSVQRLPLPKNWTAAKMTEAYGDWLTKRFRGMIRVRQDANGNLRFYLRWPEWTLLRLSITPFSRVGELRRAYYIEGGALVKQVQPPGRLEFRILPDLGCAIAALHGYAPRLPWWLYAYTQAKIHLWVMRAFSRFLQQVDQ